MTGMDQPRDCKRIAELLDFYIDRELPGSQMAEVAGHLSVCAGCREEEAEILNLRGRLQKAARSVPVPGSFPGRVSVNVATIRPVWIGVAAAALLTLLVAGYELRQLPASAGSQDSYIAEISGETPAIIQVGLKDHVHCAVFRKFPDSPPSFGEMTAELGPDYADLLPVMQKQMPAGLKVAMAHKCNYRGRQYVHLIARDKSHLVSLVIAERSDGEAFESDLQAVATGSDVSLYSSGVRTFAIAGFETPRHLVYLVSNMDQKTNLHMMESMAAPVRQALRKSEV